jgi:PRC-barrel domain
MPMFLCKLAPLQRSFTKLFRFSNQRLVLTVKQQAVRRIQEQIPGQPVFCAVTHGGFEMAERETVSLIGSDKVEGTAVYGADNTKIGSIERVMIDKVSGKVSYAVLSFGGFLGIGDDHYPLPWQSLKYDTSVEGYRTGITQQQLEGAPKYGNDNAWNWGDPARTRSVNDYYGVAI